MPLSIETKIFKIIVPYFLDIITVYLAIRCHNASEQVHVSFFTLAAEAEHSL